MSWEWLAIVMFVLFLILILSGYPVAYSFAGTAIVFGALGLSLGAFDLNLLKLLPNRWFGAMSDFTLLAIPFFVFMGAIFEKSGLAERLLNTIGMLLGPLPGGLALATWKHPRTTFDVDVLLVADGPQRAPERPASRRLPAEED